MVGRVGVGHILATMWPEDPEVRQDNDLFGKSLRERLPGNTNLTVSGVANPWCGKPASFASMLAVKRALDPKNILRGREVS